MTLDFARRMLVAGFKVGDSPYSADGFSPWAVKDPDEVVLRIADEWKKSQKVAGLEGVWFLPPAMNN